MTYTLDDIPRTHGTCEYCLRETTVYAFALWVCRRCLENDPAQAAS